MFESGKDSARNSSYTEMPPTLDEPEVARVTYLRLDIVGPPHGFRPR